MQRSDKKSKTIIVTGAAGFIGSAIIWGLNKKGTADIIIVDEKELSDEKRHNLKFLKYKDHIDKDEFIKKLGQLPIFSNLIHMGACSDTTEKDERFLLENNYEYTKVLCNYCIAKNIRFIYASSAATYGDGLNGYSDDETQIDKLKPLNPYGKSKQMFDKWAKDNKLFSKIVGLKYFNVFGPNEFHKGEMRSVVNKAYEQIRATGKLRLFKSYKPQYKDGEQKRDFLYVKDAVDMALFFMDKPKINGIFNIGQGKARTWNDLARAVFTALGKSVSIEYIDMPDNIKNQYQYFTEANISKLRKAGYKKPIIPLEDAVSDYIQNYLIPHSHLM